MLDSICLWDIPVSTHIGVPDAERKNAQTISVSVELFTDRSATGKSDDIRDGIDYDKVSTLVRDMGKIERKTLEKFAEDIATAILTTFAPSKVKVAVTKPNVCECKSVTVTIVRPKNPNT